MFLGCSLNFIHAYDCPERIPNAQSLAKEPSRTFGEQTNQFVCYPVICWLRWPCLPFMHRLEEAAVAKLCAAPTLRSPVYYRRLLLCSAFCGHHTRAHDEREKSHGTTLIGPQVCPSCAFLLKPPEPKANHTVAHLSHRQIYVLQECAGNIWEMALSAMVCIWR